MVNISHFNNKAEFLEALEKIYQEAFSKGKYAVAIKAKELQGKTVGFFMKDKKPLPFSWNDFTQEQLEALLKEAETLLKEDK